MLKFILSQNPKNNNKKSKINKLFDVLAPYRQDDRGNYWAVCPFCGSSTQFNYNIKKYVFYCYSCDAGRKQTLKDLMDYLGIEK